jgi:hypothetical protein
MSKKRLVLPLAVMECSSREIRSRLGDLILEENSGYLAVDTARVSEPLLIICTDSPQRILLKPYLQGKDQKKAKKCCDKGCGGCQIPMRSSSSIGHFADRRIRKALKKEKALARFHGAQWAKVLEKCSIDAYAPVDTLKVIEPPLAIHSVMDIR